MKNLMLPELPAYGEAVFTGIGPSDKDAGPRIDQNSLITAPCIDGIGHVVPFSYKAGTNRRLESRLQQDVLAGMPKSRRFSGLLNIHAEIDEVNHRLYVALRLVIAAHYAEGEK